HVVGRRNGRQRLAGLSHRCGHVALITEFTGLSSHSELAWPQIRKGNNVQTLKHGHHPEGESIAGLLFIETRRRGEIDLSNRLPSIGQERTAGGVDGQTEVGTGADMEHVRWDTAWQEKAIAREGV